MGKVGSLGGLGRVRDLGRSGCVPATLARLLAEQVERVGTLRTRCDQLIVSNELKNSERWERWENWEVWEP